MSSTYSGLQTSIVTKTTDYTATSSDFVILADCATADVTITLPAGTTGAQYEVKKIASSNNVYVEGSSGETFDRGSRLSLTDKYESYWVSFDGTKWRILQHTVWSTEPNQEFPVMMAPGSGGSLNADGNVGFGVSELETFSNTRNRTVAPSTGEIHSLKIELSGTSPGAGEDWTFTLYKNGSSTALTATIAQGETSATDLTNRITVVAGDTLYINVDETGTLSNDIAVSVIFEAQYQPMFGNGDCGGATRYGCVQNAQYGGSGTREHVTVFPCAGTLQTFYVDAPSCDTSGDETTVTLAKYSGGSWSDTALAITLNFDSDGSDTSDLVSTYSVSAGDILQWKYAATGGSVGRVSISCVFVPDTPGERIITGQLTTYDETDADAYHMAMGTGDDFSTSASVAANISIPSNGTASDLYVSTNPAPGATSKWIQVAVMKDGVATSLAAKVTDPAVSASDTSNSVSYTKHTNDIGINITNSGDTPDAQTWVAWGFVFS